MLKDFLEKGNCFKLICGAGNEDKTEVENLIAVYSKAGCRFFDIAAKKEIIESAKIGIEKSKQKKDRYLCISIGTKDDIHLSKAFINRGKCQACGKCKDVCSRKAILKKENKYYTDEIRCIGCQKCIGICPFNAIGTKKQEADIKDILTEYILSSVDCIEFHISGKNKKEILSEWKFLNRHFNGILSICISRKNIGDEKIIKLLTEMLSYRKPFTTIIQADGISMSGNKDDYQATLQAVASAELIQKQNFPIYLFASGGTNTKTFELAKMCGVNLCGVAIGSFARKAVTDYLKIKNLTENTEEYKKACLLAEEIIKSVTAHV
ncbi:MAG: 4Fe-4S binding protein [Candidatus Gastranaerophilales bacterium]|nr:4Fe-4S binding protein [Candidatus Gastranaerophilales bacterium]